MIPVGAHPAQSSDWRVLYREAAISPGALLEGLGLSALTERLPPGDAGFALRVPGPYRDRIQPGNPDDPLLRQVLPLQDELNPVEGYSLDAVGDLASLGARGVLHKYAGRALLIATGSCAVNCRYCFRRHFPYADELAASGQWRQALAYIAADPSLHEVLLSGGDPLALSTAKLAELTDGLKAIAHLRRLRIHTRLPVVIPQRVDAELLDWLSALPWPVAIVLHINHPQEIDAAVAAACQRLRQTGVSLLNQSVLLRGVNDAAETLQVLSERMFEIGVLPYYLHQLDRVQGAAHFQVEDRDALVLHDQLRQKLPGYLLPRLVREIAGAPYKSPL